MIPLGIRIVACSGLGSGYGGHAPQASILVRSGEGSGNVFGVCGAEPIPAGSVQENLQGIVPTRGFIADKNIRLVNKYGPEWIESLF